MKVHILEEGRYFSGEGRVVAVAENERGLRIWIAANRPTHETEGLVKEPIFMVSDTTKTWLRCRHGDTCDFVK